MSSEPCTWVYCCCQLFKAVKASAEAFSVALVLRQSKAFEASPFMAKACHCRCSYIAPTAVELLQNLEFSRAAHETSMCAPSIGYMVRSCAHMPEVQ